MAYLGIVPAITIIQQDAGDIQYQEFEVSEDTTFVLEFPEADIAQKITVEFTVTGAYTIDWNDSNSLVIQWTEGTAPSLGIGKHLIDFLYDGNGELFGTVLATDI